MTLKAKHNIATKTTTPLGEFWRFVTDFNSFYANIAKAAALAPVLDLVLNLGPPWPSRISVTTTMMMLQIVVLACSFAIWRQGKTAIGVVKAWLAAASAGFISVVLLVYIPLFIMFVRDDPNAWSRVVIGYDIQPRIRHLIAQRPNESWSSERLLREFEDAETGITDIWTPESVYLARYLLLTTWLIAMLLFGVCIASFVAIQYRGVDRSTPR